MHKGKLKNNIQKIYLLILSFIIFHLSCVGAENRSSQSLISRFEKSKDFRETIFDYIDLEIPFGKIDDASSQKNILKIEGKGSFTHYSLTDDSSQFEFLKAYRYQVKQSGFEILFQCESGRDIRQSNCGKEMLKLASTARTYRGMHKKCGDYDNTYIMSAVLKRADKRKTYLYLCSEEGEVSQSIIEEKDFDYGRLKINTQDYNPDQKSLSGLAEQTKQDEKNSKDHSVISRYRGSYIRGYQVKDFVQASLPLSAIKYSELRKPKKLNLLSTGGKATFIQYRAQPGTSQYQVIQNYLQALKKNNFDILYYCSGEKDCGDGMNDYSPFAKHSMGANAWFSCKDSSTAIITSRLRVANNRNLYMFHCITGNPWTMISQTVIEEKPIQTGLVTVTADEMKKSLASKGKVAIYGIHFNKDSDQIKLESKSSLQEIAKFLSSNPSLKLYVVGHTDSDGQEKYNQNLSQNRGQSVVKALTENHGIAKNRLQARGVGALVPISTNHASEGRQLNRRVELVEM